MDQANRLRSLMEKKKPEMPNLTGRVIAVTSGKGGVGKSNFTLNLGISLVKLNKKVVILDADFGMANIEVLFGVIPEKTILSVLRGEDKISEVIAKGPEGVHFISGGSGIADLAALTEKQIDYLVDTFVYLDITYDIILIDTGAGASHQVINLVKASKETIIITSPEPTALTDAYSMIKILKHLNHIPEMFLVINRISDDKEGEEIYFKLNRVSHRFLGLELKLLGYIPTDDNLTKAVKKQQPISILFPKSPFTKSIEKIAKDIVSNESIMLAEEGFGAGDFFSRLVKLFGR